MIYKSIAARDTRAAHGAMPEQVNQYLRYAERWFLEVLAAPITWPGRG